MIELLRRSLYGKPVPVSGEAKRQYRTGEDVWNVDFPIQRVTNAAPRQTRLMRGYLMRSQKIYCRTPTLDEIEERRRRAFERPI